MDWEDHSGSQNMRMNRIFAMNMLLNHIAGLSTVLGGLAGLTVGLFFFGRPVAGAFAGAIGFWLCLQITFWWLDRRLTRQDGKRKNDEFERRWQSDHPKFATPVQEPAVRPTK